MDVKAFHWSKRNNHSSPSVHTKCLLGSTSQHDQEPLQHTVPQRTKRKPFWSHAVTRRYSLLPSKLIVGLPLWLLWTGLDNTWEMSLTGGSHPWVLSSSFSPCQDRTPFHKPIAEKNSVAYAVTKYRVVLVSGLYICQKFNSLIQTSDFLSEYWWCQVVVWLKSLKNTEGLCQMHDSVQLLVRQEHPKGEPLYQSHLTQTPKFCCRSCFNKTWNQKCCTWLFSRHYSVIPNIGPSCTLSHRCTVPANVYRQTSILTDRGLYLQALKSNLYARVFQPKFTSQCEVYFS